MKIHLVRHAESEANAGGNTSDPSSILLTEKGKLQASDLLRKFTHESLPDLILVSSFIRTRQTAEPFIRKYPAIPVEIWPLHEFTFLSPSKCQNTTSQDRQLMVRDYWAKCDPYFIDGVGAESFIEFTHRITECIKKMQILNHPLVVVFTHGQVMRFIKQHFEIGNQPAQFAMEYFKDQMLKFSIPNTDVIEIEP